MATHAEAAGAGRPLIIPLFIPHMGCPHQCVFCNQRTITGTISRIPSPDQIRYEVKRFLGHAGKRRSRVQIAFFGGNLLGLERNTVKTLLGAATRFVDNKAVHSLRFSTRPDTVCRQSLDAIDRFPVSTVELGVQSMNDSVLLAAGRGHTAAHTVDAADLLKARGYRLGLQMMVGLPADDASGAMDTARRLAGLQPDFVRIYPTLVLNGSPLARLFRRGRYDPLPLDDCIRLVKKLFLFFKRHHIPVIRMGLQASDGLTDSDAILAGPYHPAFGHLVHAQIALDAISAALSETNTTGAHLTISVHPTRLSRVQGLNKANLTRLKQRHALKTINLIQDPTLAPNHLIVGDRCTILP